MSNSGVVSLETHQFALGQRHLVDANVWLEAFVPSDRVEHRRSAITFRAIRHARAAGSILLIAPLVLSEINNAYLRRIWQRGHHTHPYKVTRDSEEFALPRARAAHLVTQVLALGEVCQLALTAASWASIGRRCAFPGLDFNDLVLVELCRHHDLTLITNDADFKGSGIPLLTANHKLLP
ncbi:MAG: PIN domain-containing protein [bacterium]